MQARLGRSVWIPAAGATTLGLFLAGGTVVGPSETRRSGVADQGYVGRKVCAQCHEPNGRNHFASNHAGSWKPASALDDVEGLPQEIQEQGILYKVDKESGRWDFTVRLPGRPTQRIPIHSIVGGPRFGLSFILLANQVEGRALVRATLIEARYMLEAGTNRLKKSPGLFMGQPSAYNTAFGRVMSPDFADKCLDCHGGPVDHQIALDAGPHPKYFDLGVGCERCHGPGAEHLKAVERKESDLKIRHPGLLPTPQLHEVCGQCHNGFFSLVQPRPEDTLISNQVTALSSSECFRQSGGGISCLDCHDPHQNAQPNDPAYLGTCLRCHGPSLEEAVHCPVNPKDGCIGCHMPENVQQDNFHLTDHWIRVVRR